MALPELHNRIEHLVCHSSQLMYVCGGNQSNTYNYLLAEQESDTDLVLVTAKAENTDSELSAQICQQLGMQNTHNAPLNQVFSSRNAQASSIIICIKQGKFVSTSMQRQLWDWVLQSRFANNMTNVNVLLFGEQSWALQARSLLSKHQSEQPLILTAQIQLPETEAETSELDNLIAEKRAAFAKRIENRTASYETAKPSSLSPWLWLSAGLAFVALFSGILGWQYKETIVNWFTQPTTGLAVQQPNSNTPPEPSNTLLDKPEKAVTTTDENTLQLATDNEVIEVNESDTSKLVVSWHEASATLAEQHKDTLAMLKLENQKVAETAHTEVEVPTNAESVVSKDDLTTQNTVPHSAVNLANDKLAIAADNQYYIQLTAMADKDVLTTYMASTSRLSTLNIYQTMRNGQPWYVVLHSTSFSSLDDARQMIEESSLTGFVKSIGQIKRELTAL